MEEQEIYSVIGEDGFSRVIAAFYRQVPLDPVLAALYPMDDLPGAEQRLRDFLIFRFGGPQRYIEQRGHPRLRMRHAPFSIGGAARDHWLQLMRNAIAETALPEEAAAVLWAYFEPAANGMMNRL